MSTKTAIEWAEIDAVSPLRCSMLDPYDQPCGRFAAVVATTGCVHEHVSDEPTCQWCIRLYAEGRVRCHECQTCSDPHVCDAEVIRLVDLEDLPTSPETT